MAHGAKVFNFPLFAAGILGLTGVAIGAFGAHALKATLMERGMTVPWETGARYHMFHALALLGLAAWGRRAGADADGGGSKLLAWTAYCWTVGTIIFSGSLYYIAIGGPRWLGPVTPTGGLVLLAGWLLVAIAACRRQV